MTHAHPDLPAWCPASLERALAHRSEGDVAAMEGLDQRLATLTESMHADLAKIGPNRAAWVHLDGREQAVGLCVRSYEGMFVLEVLSEADTTIDDKKLVAALAINGEPGLAGLHLIDVGEGPQLFARAANLVDTMSDAELRAMISSAAKLADEWESKHTRGEDKL